MKRKEEVLLEELLFEESELMPEKAKYYAKNSCKKCYGRGIQKWSLPSNIIKFRYCDCALNKMEKENGKNI